MGVQLGFMRVQLGSKVIRAGFPGCDRSAGTAGQQPEAAAMLPDEQASSCGRLSRTLACGSIPGSPSLPFPQARHSERPDGWYCR